MACRWGVKEGSQATPYLRLWPKGRLGRAALHEITFHSSQSTGSPQQWEITALAPSLVHSHRPLTPRQNSANMCPVGGRPHSQKVTHKSHRGSCGPEDTVRCPPFLSHPRAPTSPTEPQLQHITSWEPHSETCSTPTFPSGELEGVGEGKRTPLPCQPGPLHGAVCGRAGAACGCVWMRVTN